ncbi:MAG: PEP-CTERM sorting domain-containing protein [Chitinivibrionales bacterium]|nr:PEP-CTERM sorting domain-containing protein [Chitinivibrionales bacterium]
MYDINSTEGLIMKSNTAFAVFLLSLAVVAGPVSIQRGDLQNFVADDINFFFADTVLADVPVSGAFDFTLESSYTGLAATTDIVFTESEQANELTINFNHLVDSDIRGALAGDWGYVTFRPSVDVEYSITGFYGMDGAGTAAYDVSLYASNTTEPLFGNYQYSEDVVNESFTVGATGGDSENELSGSTTGTLTANKNYSFNFNTATVAWPEPGGIKTSTGNLSISFRSITTPEPPVSVPEPSTITLLASGLLGLFGVGLVRRKNTASKK